MKKLGWYLSSLLLGVAFFAGFIYADNTSKQLQSLNREIGKGLVQIRRENPALQPSIYSLLDQVGKLYKFSSVTLKEQKKLKMALQEDKRIRFGLEDENERLKVEVTFLKQSLNRERDDNKGRLESLEQEKADLLKKREEAELKEKEYFAKVKELEQSLNKNNDSSTEKKSLALNQIKPVKDPKDKILLAQIARREKKGA